MQLFVDETSVQDINIIQYIYIYIYILVNYPHFRPGEYPRWTTDVDPVSVDSPTTLTIKSPSIWAHPIDRQIDRIR